MSHEAVSTFTPSIDALRYPFDPRTFSARDPRWLKCERRNSFAELIDFGVVASNG
jgi:hypothetical protein